MKKKVEKKALYNLLRLNWLQTPTLSVEKWQVEDLRELALPLLFARLEKFHLSFNQTSFLLYSQDVASPEELTDLLLADYQLSPSEEDQIYLLLFELWRRLLKNKRSFSIICDELDEQIALYDEQKISDLFSLQDAISNFACILNYHVDHGFLPAQAFQLINTYCAHDIELFLYDFLCEQLEKENELFVQEILDLFDHYLNHLKWLLLATLRLNIHLSAPTSLSQKRIEMIVDEHLKKPDIDFELEFLEILLDYQEFDLFLLVFKKSLAFLQVEADLQEMSILALRYLTLIKNKKLAEEVEHLLQNRSFCDTKKVKKNDLLFESLSLLSLI